LQPSHKVSDYHKLFGELLLTWACNPYAFVLQWATKCVLIR